MSGHRPTHLDHQKQKGYCCCHRFHFLDGLADRFGGLSLEVDPPVAGTYYLERLAQELIALVVHLENHLQNSADWASDSAGYISDQVVLSLQAQGASEHALYHEAMEGTFLEEMSFLIVVVQSAVAEIVWSDSVTVAY